MELILKGKSPNKVLLAHLHSVTASAVPKSLLGRVIRALSIVGVSEHGLPVTETQVAEEPETMGEAADSATEPTSASQLSSGESGVGPSQSADMSGVDEALGRASSLSGKPAVVGAAAAVAAATVGGGVFSVAMLPTFDLAARQASEAAASARKLKLARMAADLLAAQEEEAQFQAEEVVRAAEAAASLVPKVVTVDLSKGRDRSRSKSMDGMVPRKKKQQSLRFGEPTAEESARIVSAEEAALAELKRIRKEAGMPEEGPVSRKGAAHRGRGRSETSESPSTTDEESERPSKRHAKKRKTKTKKRSKRSRNSKASKRSHRSRSSSSSSSSTSSSSSSSSSSLSSSSSEAEAPTGSGTRTAKVCLGFPVFCLYDHAMNFAMIMSPCRMRVACRPCRLT